MCLPSNAHAQRISRGEFTVGFPIVSGHNASQVLGIELGAGANLNRWLGLLGQVDSHVGEVVYEDSLHTALAGPVVFRQTNPWTRLHARASFGVANNRFGSPRAAFASAFGGGVDLGERRTLHVTVDALATHFDKETQNFLRLTIGVRFPLGMMSSS
jgi:hypothetical protein